MCIKTLSASTCKGLFSSDILIGLITNKTSNIRILNFTFEFQKVTCNTKGLRMRYWQSSYMYYVHTEKLSKWQLTYICSRPVIIRTRRHFLWKRLQTSKLFSQCYISAVSIFRFKNMTLKLMFKTILRQHMQFLISLMTC